MTFLGRQARMRSATTYITASSVPTRILHILRSDSAQVNGHRNHSRQPIAICFSQCSHSQNRHRIGTYPPMPLAAPAESCFRKIDFRGPYSPHRIRERSDMRPHAVASRFHGWVVEVLHTFRPTRVKRSCSASTKRKALIVSHRAAK